MADETTVRATVTRMNDRYAVTVVLEKNGRSLTLAESPVNRSENARGTSWGYLAQGRGALSLVPGPFKPPGRNFANGENDGARFSRH